MDYGELRERIEKIVEKYDCRTEVVCNDLIIMNNKTSQVVGGAWSHMWDISKADEICEAIDKYLQSFRSEDENDFIDFKK